MKFKKRIKFTDRKGYEGIYPPSCEQALLYYYGYHKVLQAATGKISSSREAAILVAEDVQCWWRKTGIKTKTLLGILYMIKKLVKDYGALSRNKSREGENEKNQRDRFLDKLQNTLWVVDKDTEKYLRTSTNPKCIQDWNYLEKVRGKNRLATLGSVDYNDLKTKKRKRVREEQIKKKARSKQNTYLPANDTHLSNSSDEGTDKFDFQDPDIKINNNTKTPKQVKPKKDRIITPEFVAMTEKHSLSNRAAFEILAASTSNKEPNEKILSVRSVSRKRKLFVKEIAENVYHNEMHIPSDYYIIHWDGKKFKASTHCGKNQEKLAVILTTSNGNEIQLGIIPVQNGTAYEQHNKIIELIIEKDISLKKIIACVFDTTSVNTGEINGIVRRMQISVGHPILELACRHHIYELVCGAASEIILGKTKEGKDKKSTTAPYEPMFRNLCDSWKNMDKENLYIFEKKSVHRILLGHINMAKEFLTIWLQNEKTMRKDYKEMAILSLKYLGGDLPDKFSKFKLQAPSAYHHARWMSKVLYVLKIAMLKPPFVENIAKIRTLALFYSTYYAKAWLTSIFAAEAPLHDLEFIQTLEKVCSVEGTWPEGFQMIAKSAMDKLKLHTWYISERLVPLVLFSNLDDRIKEQVRRAIIKYKDEPQHEEQQRPEKDSFQDVRLTTLVGSDSYRLFELLKLNKDLLHIPVSKWNVSNGYEHAVNSIKMLPVVNDAAERALGMATKLDGPTMPKDEEHIQSLYKVVDASRKIQGSIATSTERVTKRNVTKFLKCKIFQDKKK